MEKFRLIAITVALLLYLLALYPWQTIAAALVLAVAYIVLKNLNASNTIHQSKARRRREALSQARIYLAPYSDIWRSLRLSNKYCTLRLAQDGKTISAKENSIYGERTLRVIESKVHSTDDLWDMMCISFDHNTSFDGLVELFRRFEVQVRINGESQKPVQTINVLPASNSHKEVKTEKEKLDVNNASEVELTALPGVSIVMAKKLIKKREDIGGFKSVNDVFLFLRLKPHMQSQLENLICVKKMKGSVNIKRYEERKIDL